MNQNQTPVWNTLIAEQDIIWTLEHYMDSNNTYTNHSSGHPISVDSKFQNAYFKA